MARELIRGGGARLHVEVRPRLWTRYSIVFPAARVVRRSTGTAARDLPPAVKVHRAPNGTLEVLVVDDNEMVRTVLRKYLERKGHEVTEAVDGGVALEILRERGFDHVMVDIDMPGTTGIEFFRQLDSVAPEMRERTVFMTGGFQEGAAEDFIQGTGRPHIQKPFDLKEIADILQA
jgi:CheY-like chemotaxis protein